MPRIALPLALLLVLALAPAVAQADDQSFARTAIGQAVTLDRHERAVSSALGKVDRKGVAAVPAARRAIKLARRQVDRLLAAVKPEQTSTPDGAAAKKQLFMLLKQEKDGYGTLDSALVAYKAGDAPTARTLLTRAKRTLAGVRKAAARLGSTLQTLAA